MQSFQSSFANIASHSSVLLELFYGRSMIMLVDLHTKCQFQSKFLLRISSNFYFIFSFWVTLSFIPRFGACTYDTDFCLQEYTHYSFLFVILMCSYEEVLHPMGFKAISILDNDLAVKPRKVCIEIALVKLIKDIRLTWCWYISVAYLCIWR